jgi:deoxyribonuclease-1
MIRFVIASLLTSFSCLAFVDSRLPNGHLSYWGEDFYKTQLTAKQIKKSVLHNILASSHASVAQNYDQIGNASCVNNCYRHNMVGYSQARKIIFGDLYKKVDGNKYYVVDVYCERKVYFNDVNDIANMSHDINIEHTWPQSKFNPAFNKELQKSDLHHLYPTDSLANNRRANHEFGEVNPQDDELNVSKCASSQLSDVTGDFRFTPPMEHKGNVARALFYFSVRYNLPLEQAQELILRQWDKVDPIDADEIQRHEKIAIYQTGRNPFVDFPRLADKISDF